MTISPQEKSAKRDANEIVSHASLTGAGRVVFRMKDKYLFFDIQQDILAKAILEFNPPRYKLQKNTEGKWVDASKYYTVNGAAQALSALERGDINTALGWRPEEVAQAAKQNIVAFHQTLRTVLKMFATGPQEWRSVKKVRKIGSLLNSLSQVISDPYLEYAQATTRLYEEIGEISFKEFPDREVVSRLVDKVKETITSESPLFSSDAGLLAAHMSLAKLHSLHDRNTAAGYYRKIRESELTGLVKFFYTDTGSMTYFSAEEISEAGQQSAGLIRDSIVDIDVADPQNEFGVLISVDPHFFRIYAPLLLFYAQQLPEIELNIVMCTNDKDSCVLTRDMDWYLHGLSALTGLEKPRNIHIFRMPIPSFVTESKTFFATARFFAINRLLQRYDRLYVMDADLATDTDPRPFLDSIKGLVFSVPATNTFPALSPWRRFMAGNLAVDKSVLETEILNDLQDYLAYGLQFENSWMLDQNALAYSVERNRGVFSDLSPLRRPFKQPKFRSVWEARYWKHSVHSTK